MKPVPSLGLLHVGGSPRIHAGVERFSAPEGTATQSRALALGLECPWLKPRFFSMLVQLD